MTVLHNAAVGECVANDDPDIVKKCTSVVSQDCFYPVAMKGVVHWSGFSNVKLILMLEKAW